MKRNFLLKRCITPTVLFLAMLSLNVTAQSAAERQIVDEAGGGWWFSVILFVFAGIGVALYLWKKSKKGADQQKKDITYANYHKNESYELQGNEADRDLELLRKSKKSVAKPKKLTLSPNTAGAKVLPPVSRIPLNTDIDTKAFQEKMRKLQYSQLPINTFNVLTPSKLYEPLPISDDPSVLNAIEQANDEFEEDEAVRELAVRILTAFRTRNSVEALSQIALYDLSSNVRAKSVSILTDFDHESVFEAILLACADPTREVRAAAARGLFRLNFDRADAWKRIIETNDKFRMSHAARAAIESGIVVKSFDRLVHEDMKVAYEAFTLISLIIKSGETDGLFNSIRTHKDERVKFALLHVLKVQKDERTLAELNKLDRDGQFPTDVAERIRAAVLSFEQVMA